MLRERLIAIIPTSESIFAIFVTLHHFYTFFKQKIFFSQLWPPETLAAIKSTGREYQNKHPISAIYEHVA